jgi:hypothetical protein
MECGELTDRARGGVARLAPDILAAASSCYTGTRVVQIAVSLCA